MNADENNLSLDQISTWKVDSLRTFLSRRGLSADGNKDELIALCYAAAKMKIEIQPTADEYLKKNAKDYENLLNFDGIEVPDPLKLCENWVDEKEGIKVWPPVFLSDIANFLMSNNCDQAIAARYLNDYKIGKAYEYLSADWIKEIFFHVISKSSAYCFLRAKCTPSQRLRDDDHTIWTCIVKETGEIKSAYCSCTAGLGQTCNHIAGLLFRVERANKLGLSACTSLPCTWNVPRATKIAAKKVSEIVIKKSRHGKDQSRPLVSKEKSVFKPLPDTVLNQRKCFTDSLKVVLPNAVFCKGIEMPDESGAGAVTEKEEQFSNRIIDAILMDNIAVNTSSNRSVESFIESQPKLTESDINFINNATTGQSNNTYWQKIRHGRLTSSNFYRIYTRVNSFKEDQNTDMTSLVSSIMGYTSPNPNLKPFKYGRESEPLAKVIYQREYQKMHKTCTFNECGIFLDGQNSYIGSSPDMLVACECCGRGLLEVKAVMIGKCDKCTSFCKCNLPVFLYSSNGSLKVKKIIVIIAKCRARWL